MLGKVHHAQQQPDLWQCMCNKSLPDPVFPFFPRELPSACALFPPHTPLPLGSSLHFPPPPPPEEGGEFLGGDVRRSRLLSLHTAFCGARGREAPTALVNLHPPVETRCSYCNSTVFARGGSPDWFLAQHSIQRFSGKQTVVNIRRQYQSRYDSKGASHTDRGKYFFCASVVGEKANITT